MSVASVGSGEGEYGGGRLPAVIPPSASLSLPQYFFFRYDPQMCCVALAKLLSIFVLQLPQLSNAADTQACMLGD